MGWKKKFRRAFKSAAKSMAATASEVVRFAAPAVGSMMLGPIGGVLGSGVLGIGAVAFEVRRRALFNPDRWTCRWKPRWTTRGARGEEADVRRVS